MNVGKLGANNISHPEKSNIKAKINKKGQNFTTQSNADAVKTDKNKQLSIRGRKIHFNTNPLPLRESPSMHEGKSQQSQVKWNTQQPPNRELVAPSSDYMKDMIANGGKEPIGKNVNEGEMGVNKSSIFQPSEKYLRPYKLDALIESLSHVDTDKSVKDQVKELDTFKALSKDDQEKISRQAAKRNKTKASKSSTAERETRIEKLKTFIQNMKMMRETIETDASTVRDKNSVDNNGSERKQAVTAVNIDDEI